MELWDGWRGIVKKLKAGLVTYSEYVHDIWNHLNTHELNKIIKNKSKDKSELHV